MIHFFVTDAGQQTFWSMSHLLLPHKKGGGGREGMHWSYTRHARVEGYEWIYYVGIFHVCRIFTPKKIFFSPPSFTVSLECAAIGTLATRLRSSGLAKHTQYVLPWDHNAKCHINSPSVNSEFLQPDSTSDTDACFFKRTKHTYTINGGCPLPPTAIGRSCGKPHPTTVLAKYGRASTHGEAKVMRVHLALSQQRQQWHAVLCFVTGSGILHHTRMCNSRQNDSEQNRHGMVKYT